MDERRKKALYEKGLVLAVMALLFGYFAGAVLTLTALRGMSFLAAINSIGEHPWNLLLSKYTFLAVGGGLLAVGLWIMEEMTKPQKYRDYAEYGTAEFAKPKEVNKVLQDPDPENNRIISREVKISMNTRYHGINLNELVIGGSGAGKSLYLATPVLMHQRGSFVVTDPKGEMLRRMGSSLQDKGYTIKVVNLINPDDSDCYNPFRYIRNEEDIDKLAHNFLENTADKKGSRGDSFWTDSAEALLSAVCLYVWMEELPRNKTLPYVARLFAGEHISDEGEDSYLGKKIHRLQSNHPARLKFDKVYVGAADTVRSVLSVLNSRMRSLLSPRIERLLSDDTIDMADLGTGHRGDGRTPTALFLVIPDSDKTFNYIPGLIYTQLFIELYFFADTVYGGSLPLPVTLVMDEFANIALPDDFTTIISTMRSRNINVIIIIQAIAQLKVLFKDAWEIITGNADTLIYLGGNEASTHEYISKRLGNETIDKQSDSQNLGKNGSASISHDHMQHALMSPSEVALLPPTKCIIFIRGQNPYVDDKYDTLHDPVFQKYSNLPYEHPAGVIRDRRGNVTSIKGSTKKRMEALSSESLEFYQKLNKVNDSVQIYKCSSKDLLMMNVHESRLEDLDPFMQPEKSGVSMDDPASDVLEYIEGLLTQNDYSADQRKIIAAAYKNGYSIGEIRMIANPIYTAERMGEIFNLIESLRYRQSRSWGEWNNMVRRLPPAG